MHISKKRFLITAAVVILLAYWIWMLWIWSTKKKYKVTPNNTKKFRFQKQLQEYIKEQSRLIVANVQSMNSSQYSDLNLSHTNKTTIQPSSTNKHLFIVLNLEHRRDRQIAITEEFQKTNISLTWGSTINPRLPEHLHLTKDCFDERTCPGQVGCQMSHIWAIENAIELDLDYVAIVEDDFRFHSFVDPAYVSDALRETMTKWVPEWDVIAGSLNMIETQILFPSAVSVSPTTQLDIVRIHEAQTTTFYIVRKSIFLPLLQAYKECDVKKDYHTAIDQCFKPLQKTSMWIGFSPQLGTQSPSFSDIESAFVNYGF